MLLEIRVAFKITMVSAIFFSAFLPIGLGSLTVCSLYFSSISAVMCLTPVN